MRRYLVPALAALAFVAGPATAGTVRVDVPVSYADLDLSRPEHVELLKQRLQSAAAQACAQARPALSVQPASDKTCTAGAYRRAVAVLAKRMPQQVAVRD